MPRINRIEQGRYSATIKHKASTGEWVARFFENGRWLGDGPSYYGEEYTDTLETAKAILTHYNKRTAHESNQTSTQSVQCSPSPLQSQADTVKRNAYPVYAHTLPHYTSAGCACCASGH